MHTGRAGDEERPRARLLIIFSLFFIFTGINYYIFNTELIQVKVSSVTRQMLNPLKSLRNRFSFLNKKHFIGLDSRCSKFRVWAAFHTAIMAHSKWEYVKAFETDDTLLPNCWAVARIDGRGFHKLAKKHEWKRPNDTRALALMNQAAKHVMLEYSDIILSYGQSDEYSFVFRREAEIFQRRSAKVITTLVSKFSSAFVYHWHEYFPDQKLQYPPSFDGRIILYPTDRNLRDYLCWRQADCHINNLYNTTFWALVQQGKMGNNEAQQRLSGTLSGDKNEILFSQFGINYNNEPEIFRKGTVFVQKSRSAKMPRKAHKENKKREPELPVDELSLSENIVQLSCDIIGDQFWKEYPHLIPTTGETTGEDSEAKLIANAHAQQATQQQQQRSGSMNEIITRSTEPVANAEQQQHICIHLQHAPQQQQQHSQPRQKKILKIVDPSTGKHVI